MPPLPPGYTREPPDTTRDLVPGEQLYGGADISRVWDADGAEYMACCCRKESDGVFGFRIFRGDGEVSYRPFCHGRGELGYNFFNGRLIWSAWEGSEWKGGEIPGAAPFPAPLTMQEIMTFICRRLADPSAPLTQAVRRAAG